VKSVILKDEGTPFDYSPGTIPDIFDAIQNALSDDKKVEIEAYDDVLGFPSGEVKIDIDAFAYDGGTFWILSSFKVLSPCSALTNCRACSAYSCFWQEESGCDTSCELQDTGCWGSGVQCPALACTGDAKECPDGTWVSRDGNRNCEFEACPPLFCAQDVKECSDGSFVSRDPEKGCSFELCPSETLACTEEAKECPDGSFVARDPTLNCEFSPCPGVACTLEAKICDNGSTIGRNPARNCEFELCPGEVSPWVLYHKREVESHLMDHLQFKEVEILDVLDSDILVRVISEPPTEESLDRFKEEFASAINVQDSRVSISGWTPLSEKRQESQWLVTVNVDEPSPSSVVRASLMTLALLVGWLWI